MAGADQVDDRLLVAIQGQTALVRVCGRGSFKISPALKQFGLAAANSSCTRMLMDMEQCVGMDSTFMGVVAGLAFNLSQKTHGQVVMVNLSAKTRGLLTTLGLDQIVQAYMTGAVPEEWRDLVAASGRWEAMNAVQADQRTTAETMLEAHENLVQLTPENFPKFKDVLTFLREDLKKNSEGQKKT